MRQIQRTEFQIAPQKGQTPGEGAGPLLSGKKPRISECTPPYHDRITTAECQQIQPLAMAVNIAITDNRDPHRLLDLPYHLPIGLAAKGLRPGTAMHGEQGRSGSLRHLGKFHRIESVCIPAAAEFDRNRYRTPGANGADDGLGKFALLHQGHTCPPLGHFAHRTAHVQVNTVHRQGTNLARRLRHHLGHGPEELHNKGPLRRHALQHGHGLALALGKTMRADHFGKDHSRTLLAAEQAERQIGIARQRGEHKGTVETQLRGLRCLPPGRKGCGRIPGWIKHENGQTPRQGLSVCGQG